MEQKLQSLKVVQREMQEKEAELQAVAEEVRKLAHASNVLDVKDLESHQQEERP